MSGTPTEDQARAQHIAFASAANNEAWGLVEQAARSEAEDERLLHLAHAAAWHWSRAGTDLHRARADLLVALAHVHAGSGAVALRVAKRTHAFLCAPGRDCPDWERALSTATLAAAHGAAGDADRQADLRREAARLGEAIADEQDRGIFEATFRSLP